MNEKNNIFIKKKTSNDSIFIKKKLSTHNKNYEMAKMYFNSRNYKMSEYYCHKLLENNPNNIEYLLLMGEAIGWQSSLNNYRINETIYFFSKCIQQSSPSTKNIYAVKCLDSLLELFSNLLDLRSKEFINLPNSNNTIALQNEVKYIIDSIEKIAFIGEINIKLESKLANFLDCFCIDAINTLQYESNKINYCSREDMIQISEYYFNIINIEEFAIQIETEIKNNKKRYRTIIDILKKIRKLKFYYWDYGLIHRSLWTWEFKNILDSKIKDIESKIL